MNDTYIVMTFVVLDDVLKAYAYQEDSRAQSSAAEVLTVAVVAAKYFQKHHERALVLLRQLGYVRRLSIARFNRRLHALNDWLYGLVNIVGEVFAHGEVFLI